MASKKSTSTAHSHSTVNLTPTDKLALAVEVLIDREELQAQICDYAVALQSSPFMLRYLRDSIESIQNATVMEQAESRMSLAIANLHFAKGMRISC